MLKTTTLCFFILVFARGAAQDFQVRQPFISPLAINPAMAGTPMLNDEQNLRVTGSYSLGFSRKKLLFTQKTISFDGQYKQTAHNYGIKINHEWRPLFANSNYVQANLFYAFKVPKLTLAGGAFKIGISSSFNYEHDTFVPRPLVPDPVLQAHPYKNERKYLALNAGLIWFKQNTQLGIAIYNINRPNASQLENLVRKKNSQLSGFAAHRFQLFRKSNTLVFIVPSVMYSNDLNRYSILQAGAKLELKQFRFGAFWQHEKGFNNQFSNLLNVQMGYQFDRLRIIGNLININKYSSPFFEVNLLYLL